MARLPGGERKGGFRLPSFPFVSLSVFLCGRRVLKRVRQWSSEGGEFKLSCWIDLGSGATFRVSLLPVWVQLLRGFIEVGRFIALALSP